MQKLIPFLDCLKIDQKAQTPLHRQIYNQLQSLILNGQLKYKSILPSSRVLADHLGVGRNTVTLAYELLTAEGYLEASHGVGTWVNFEAPTPASKSIIKVEGTTPDLSRRGLNMSRLKGSHPRRENLIFHPGQPDMTTFPATKWARLLRRHTKQTVNDLFGYTDRSGYPALKQAICNYLSLSRGLTCSPDQVIITSGTQAGLDLLARMLLDQGDGFLIEEPGYPGAYEVFSAAGGLAHFLPVLSNGWNMEALEGSIPTRCMFLTPSCQWPRSNVMQVNERNKVLQIAEDHNAWIIEDDYDSEYRFSGSPIPTLFSQGKSENIIYMGTFSKTMYPALRIGFMVAPIALTHIIAQAIETTAQYPPLLLQAALADFIEEGYFATHLRKMRHLYKQRMSTFLIHAQSILGDWLTFEKCSGGMQIIGTLRAGFSDIIVANRAYKLGVSVTPLSQTYHGSEPVHGLIIGFAGFDEAQTLKGLSILRKALEEYQN